MNKDTKELIDKIDNLTGLGEGIYLSKDDTPLQAYTRALFRVAELERLIREVNKHVEEINELNA